MANTTIPNLPPAISLDGTELWELVQNGVSRRATTQQLVNLASSGSGTVTLINTAGALTGGPITGSGTISLAANAVTNQYLAPMGPGTLKGNLTGSTADPQDVTVNAVLDSIGATPGSMLYRGAGAWTLVPPGTTGQYLTTSGAVPQWGNLSVGPSSLTPTGVSAGTYGTASSIPQFTVLASGQLSAAGNVSIQISTSQVTGLGTMATQNATAVAITGGTMNGVVIGGGAPAAASFTNILAGTWLGTAIGVAYGGTGSTTAPGARSNLGAAASGAVGSSGITMSSARLLGRSTAGTGAIEEITIGANLTLSGGVLSATGGGGGGTATNLAGGAAGSVPYQSAVDTTTFLAIGAANTVLTSSGTAPQWSTSLTLAGTVSATKFIPVSGGTVTGNGMYLSGTNEISFSTNGVRRFTILDNGYYAFSDTARVGVSTSPSFNLADGLGVYNGRDLSVWSSSTATTGDYARIGWNGSIPRLLYGNSSISNGTDFAIQVQGSTLPEAVMYFRGDRRVKVGIDTTFRGSASSGAATWGIFQVGSNTARNESIFLLNSTSTAALSILDTSGDLQISTFDARNIIFGRNFNTTFAETMRLWSSGGATIQNRLAVNTSQIGLSDGVTVWNSGEVSINSGVPSGSNQIHLRMVFSGAEPQLVFGAYGVSGGANFGIYEQGASIRSQRMFFDTNNRVMVGSLTPFRGNTGAQFGALQVGFNNDTNVSIFAANSVSTSAFTILGTSGDLQISTFDARNIIFGRNFNTTFVEAMRLTSTGGMTVAGTTTLSALTASTVLTLNASKEIVGVTSVPVANGGTGATDAATARTNLTAQKTITSGTATPTGGVSGDIYLQYT